MMRTRVLLLAGSTEASSLARLLADLPEFEVTVSFAGRTATRTALPSSVSERVGGFGGVAGLARYIVDQRVAAVVDATHPFARQMPLHAHSAGLAAGVPVMRLVRPPWVQQSADSWLPAADVHAAAELVRESAAERVLLTIGRQELSPFAVCAQHLLARCIDAPNADVLPGAELLLARGPFTLAEELRLLRSRSIDLIVAKNSGGTATRAKVDAAREMRIPIVMVQRPAITDGPAVATAAEAVQWLQR